MFTQIHEDFLVHTFGEKAVLLGRGFNPPLRSAQFPDNRGYQEALDDFGITQLLSGIRSYSDDDFEADRA